MENKLNLVYSSSIDKLVSANESFDRGVMHIAYHGKNNNKTHISKEAFEDALGSIYNCPVVCNYQVREDLIGGHDMELVESQGTYKLINCTHPVGIVPESANTYWETVIENDGAEHEYLCSEILLWKRQSAYSHIKENGVTSESMEIKVLSGETKDDGYYYISKFEFTAFCLLERDRPCFESAGIEVFSLDRLKSECEEMLADLKREFALVNPADADDDISKNSLEGGDKPLNIEELMSKYGLNEEDIDFEFGAMELSEVEERFAQIRENKIANEHVDDQQNAEPAAVQEESFAEDAHIDEPAAYASNDAGIEQMEYSLTAQQMVQEVVAALCAETYMSEYWGAIPRYSYVDYDPSVSKVYAIDCLDYKMYGFVYSMSGDNVVVDFDNKVRVKIAYVEFDNGDSTDDTNYEWLFAGREHVFESAFAANKKQMEEQIADLQQYKDGKIAEERKINLDKLFAEFSDLEEVEAFAVLKADCENNSEMSIEDVEEKCFALRGRNSNTAEFKFSAEEAQNIRLPIDGMSGITNEPYNGIFLEFGIGQR